MDLWDRSISWRRIVSRWCMFQDRLIYFLLWEWLIGLNLFESSILWLQWDGKWHRFESTILLSDHWHLIVLWGSYLIDGSFYSQLGRQKWQLLYSVVDFVGLGWVVVVEVNDLEEGHWRSHRPTVVVVPSSLHHSSDPVPIYPLLIKEIIYKVLNLDTLIRIVVEQAMI